MAYLVCHVCVIEYAMCIYCNQRKVALAHIPAMNFEEDESSSSSFADGCVECCFLGEDRFLCASDSDAVGMVYRDLVGLQHHNKVDAHTNAKAPNDSIFSNSVRFLQLIYLVIYLNRKSSLYLPLGSVNLVLKLMGTPDEISSPPG